MLIRILHITIYNKISNRNSKIDDIEAAEADTGQQDDLRDTAENADGNEDKGAQEEEVGDKKEVIVSLAKLQEQLDEIRSNMAANNGRLDDIVLNKLLNIDALVLGILVCFQRHIIRAQRRKLALTVPIFGMHCSHR